MKSWLSKSLRDAALCIAAALAAAAASPGPDAAAIASDATRTLAAERHGVTAYVVHYSYEERGPAHLKTNGSDELRVRQNGNLVAIKILSEQSNGNPASSPDVAKDQAKMDRQLPSDDYVLPLTAQGLADYKFGNAACTECPSGSEAIAFTSLKRDDEHGDGIAAVDLASHHVLWLQFSPSAMPSHVDSASITMTFGRALPDLWDVVDEKQRYDGHVLFMHGWAEVKRTYKDYRRYPDVKDALQASP